MALDGAMPPNETAGSRDFFPEPGSVTSDIGIYQVNRGLADAAANFRYSDLRRCQDSPKKPLVPVCNRCTSFIEQCANGDVYEAEHALLILDELFKEGRLSPDQYRDALRGLGTLS